jgi:hypothetical protein
MAKTPDPRSSRRGAGRQPTMKAPPPPKSRGKPPKTDAERLDDVLKKSPATELDDDRVRKTGKRSDDG